MRVFDLRDDPDAKLSPLVDHVRAGGLVAYPTETVYGIGGACTSTAAARVREVKGRGAMKPLIVLVSSRSAIDGLEWNADADELASVF